MEQNKKREEDQIQKHWKQDKERGMAIAVAVDIKSLFELYAYRIIDHDAYQRRVRAICEEYLSGIEKLEQDYPEN